MCCTHLYGIFRTNLIASINLHRQHSEHYLAFIVIVFSSTIAALSNFETIGNFLAIGPTVNFFLCILATQMCNRFYESFLEEISIAAKIEDQIELFKRTYINKDNESNYSFANDKSILPTRWLEDRNKYKSSETFVNDFKNRGSNGIICKIFKVLGIANLFFATYILFFLK